MISQRQEKKIVLARSNCVKSLFSFDPRNSLVSSPIQYRLKRVAYEYLRSYPGSDGVAKIYDSRDNSKRLVEGGRQGILEVAWSRCLTLGTTLKDVFL